MSLVNNLKSYLAPLRNPKVIGTAMLLSLIIAGGATYLDIMATNSRIDRIYRFYGGMEYGKTTEEKVAFIRNNPIYNPTNDDAIFLNRIKPLK